MLDGVLSDGQDVVGTDRISAGSPGFRFVLGDLSDAGMASKVIRGADAVIHMGAIPGPRSAEPQARFHTNGVSTSTGLMPPTETRVPGPVKKSSRATTRPHPGPTSRASAESPIKASDVSAEGAALHRLPPIVPTCRSTTEPSWPAAQAITGYLR